MVIYEAFGGQLEAPKHLEGRGVPGNAVLAIVLGVAVPAGPSIFIPPLPAGVARKPDPPPTIDFPKSPFMDSLRMAGNRSVKKHHGRSVHCSALDHMNRNVLEIELTVAQYARRRHRLQFLQNRERLDANRP